ncbi:MAG TPA: SIS domain-containing protein, partial [Arthrobacter sp.]|nr:SIS domain-containing protein [Arthrobacter sp.]
MNAELPLTDVQLQTPFALRSGTKVATGENVVDWAFPDPAAAVEAHLRNVVPALDSLRRQSPQLAAWGAELARRLLAGNRLLAAGNGGSAAEAQHLTAELVGRFDGERAPFSAISLHADTSAVIAIANDYGFEELYAR